MSKLDELELRFRDINEIESFLLAIFSITTFGIGKLIYSIITGQSLYYSLIAALFTLIAATIAVVPHEFAHRQVARKYGCFSRFTLSFSGFLATSIINLFGIAIVFFSGYTLISCNFFRANKKLDGITAAAGPATNLIVSAIFYVLATLFFPSLAGILFFYIAMFNSAVAFFNLLPFWVLDGAKIMRWDIKIWVLMIAVSLIMMVLTGVL
ncbi:site-2 protease family protein [Acidianus sp. HS-5]|uniref:site-2 protease family protein n=1 Tax=Acidianus sp. HS-5 TaxID=2886040 RepID=UPI001F1FF167|nr:site-2 protease family protein [Acidianus sp. HS-5]BDC19456.1 peptidase M50 [Acidianus sp. HS-5]